MGPRTAPHQCRSSARSPCSRRRWKAPPGCDRHRTSPDDATAVEGDVADVYPVPHPVAPGAGGTRSLGELDPAPRRADSRDGIVVVEDPHGNTAVVANVAEVGAVRGALDLAGGQSLEEH